ncbi:MAG: DUF1329 domain-containing protein [Rhodocyclaceae bacterium]|nr:DUF1329 domain-containing protein [Rhodocyclaceae bacterium]
MKPIAFLPAPCLLALMSCGALAASDDEVERSFDPYRNGFPTAPGVVTGVVVRKDNLDAFREVLDPGLAMAVGRGWYEIRVGPTTRMPMPSGYVEATRRNPGKARLGSRVGDIEGYVAGRPFIEEPDVKDARAGEKLAWNFRYGAGFGESTTVYPFYWRYRDMKSGTVERTLKFSAHALKFKHRYGEPAPDLPGNTANLYLSIYLKALEPQDLKNTQLLIQRYDDDHKLDDAFMSLGVQRRVRRLATGQTTDAFLGSDVMIEDFEGYNGRISEMKWTFRGARNILMPYFAHAEMKPAEDLPPEADGYRFIAFTGQGNCFPDITWQLRKTYVLEAEPVTPNHPVSKRVFYMDAQSMHINLGLIYDRKGELWKIAMLAKSHPDHHLPENKGAGGPVDDAFASIDVQAMHCTTGQFKTRVDAKTNQPALFQVQNMRGE